MSLFIQLVILMVVLACMVMVLLAIRQLIHYESFDDNDETSRLKEDLNEDGRVLSNNNIFHNLVELEQEKDNPTKKL